MLRSKTFWVIAAMLVFYFFSFVKYEEPVNWNHTFAAKDKIPYGGYIVFEEMDQLFPNQRIIKQDEPFVNYLPSATAPPKNLVIASSELYLQNEELQQLLDFVSKGNSVFISAGVLSRNLMNALDFDIVNGRFDSWDEKTTFSTIRNRKVDSFYHFKMPPTGPKFNLDTSFKGKILGRKEGGQTMYIRVPFGKGDFYLHLYPELLANYNWIKNPGYSADVLSFLPQQETWWDEFHKPFHNQLKNELDYVSNTRQLRWAWNVFYAGCFLLIFFLAKRKQRPVPVITSPANDSLEFIETLSNLYLREENHNDIARKRVRYFYHHARKHFQLNGNEDDFWERLSSKSSWDIKQAQNLKAEIALLNLGGKMSKKSLMELNVLIDSYYKSINKQSHE